MGSSKPPGPLVEGVWANKHLDGLAKLKNSWNNSPNPHTYKRHWSCWHPSVNYWLNPMLGLRPNFSDDHV